jgi:PEP-CTERM motif-containing protein
MIMKRLLASLLLIVWESNVVSQGTVTFDNLNFPAGLKAPVYEADGITPLSGSQFVAQLLGGPSATTLTSIAKTGFLADGFFNGGTQGVPGVGGFGTAWVQVDVWNTASGASFAQAMASGLPNSWWQSPIFTVVTGNPNLGGGPSMPGVLNGLGTSPVFLNGLVPEPSTFALAGFGAAALLYMRRCRRQGTR